MFCTIVHGNLFRFRTVHDAAMQLIVSNQQMQMQKMQVVIDAYKRLIDAYKRMENANDADGRTALIVEKQKKKEERQKEEKEQRKEEKEQRKEEKEEKKEEKMKEAVRKRKADGPAAPECPVCEFEKDLFCSF